MGTIKVDVRDTGDILYRVDPRRLSVKVFKVNDETGIYGHTTTTHENFSLEGEKNRFQLPLGKDPFPFEFRGQLYFRCEDDANDYIRTQIGCF